MKFFNQILSGLQKIFHLLVLLLVLGLLVYVVIWRIDHLFTATLGDKESLNLLYELQHSKEDIENLTQDKPKKAPKTILVDIPTGASPEEVGQILAQAGLVEDPTYFSQMVLDQGLEGYFTPGLFEFEEDASQEQIIEDLTQEGLAKAQESIEFTIVSGSSPEEVASLLLERGLITHPPSFVKMLEDQGLINNIISGDYVVEKPIKAQELLELITGQTGQDPVPEAPPTPSGP
ncbi:MAG: hypothetical protein Q4E37_03935 [Tissierellia bacterium]|nr:hypothetical protein [Tissierellia bacterium]